MAPINASEFMSRLETGDPLNIIDVREELEYATYNIGGKNVPLSTMPASITALGYNKTDEIVVICKIGMRSKTALQILGQHGYHNVRNLSGGLIAIQKLDQ